MNVRANGKNLEIEVNGNWEIVQKFPSKITQYGVIEQNLIVVKINPVTKTEIFYRNIYLLEPNGNIRWQIAEADIIPDPSLGPRRHPYSGFEYSNGILQCSSQYGDDYNVDLNTGHVVCVGFSK